MSRACGAALEATWLAAVLLVPLAVNPWGFNYELPKITSLATTLKNSSGLTLEMSSDLFAD